MAAAVSASPTLDLGDGTVARLVEASRTALRRPPELVFPDVVPPLSWCTSPELVGLWGTGTWQGLGPEAQRRVSFWEAVNFFSLNIHGERALMAGLSSRLYRKHTTAVTPYLHWFLEEENRHSQAFGTFCLRYAGKVYPPRQAPYAPEETGDAALDDLGFFTRALLFEEVADYHNRRMQGDDRLLPVARAINAMHHRDESRHLQFGRLVVRRLWESHAAGWPESVKAQLRRHLVDYLEVTWRQYYNPLAYRDAGVGAAVGAADEGWAAPAQVERRRQGGQRVEQFLSEIGIFPSPASPEETGPEEKGTP